MQHIEIALDSRERERREERQQKEEETNGRQLQLESKTDNQSALAVTKANQTELAKVEEFYAERYPSISKGGSGYTGGGSGSSAGRSAGSSVGLSRQVSGGGQKQLSGYKIYLHNYSPHNRGFFIVYY